MIEAMGGELVITARFPNVSVCINHVALGNNDTVHSQVGRRGSFNGLNPNSDTH